MKTKYTLVAKWLAPLVFGAAIAVAIGSANRQPFQTNVARIALPHTQGSLL